MIAVRVPATSANLGPGFDCLGLAVGLYLEVTLSPAAHDTFLYRDLYQDLYQRERSLPDTPDNLVHQGFRAVYERLGQYPPPVRLEVNNAIPLARGLGSSSAALVAGAALADALLGYPLGREGVFQYTAQLEGHPDNVAPAVFGQFTVSTLAEGRYVTRSLPFPAWPLLFAVPSFELLTSTARSVLPEHYSRADAIFNMSRAALWTTAVTLQDTSLLRVACRDRLHEPYREGLIPGMAACQQHLYELGVDAVFLSGAGPTLGAVCLEPTRRAQAEAVMQRFVQGGRVLRLSASDGYRYGRGGAAGDKGTVSRRD